MKKFIIFVVGFAVGCLVMPVRSQNDNADFKIVGYNERTLFNEIVARIDVNLVLLMLFDTPLSRSYVSGYQRGAGDVVAMMQRYGWLPGAVLPPPTTGPGNPTEIGADESEL